MKENKPRLEIVEWPTGAMKFSDEPITTVTLRKPGLSGPILGITCAVFGAVCGWIAHGLLTGGHTFWN